MLAKRIIPCLDVKEGRVVKGVHFLDLKDVADPISVARRYEEEGADELVFLDITASFERRQTVFELVKNVAACIFTPFTVGGGVRSIDDIRKLLCNGADKVSMNTAAVQRPSLVKEASSLFGSQCITVAIDAKLHDDGWHVYIYGGREDTGMDAIKWAKEVESLGAGEILLTSMDADGTCEGYDIELTRRVCESVKIPVIASGGAGNPQHLYEVFLKTGASAALAASIFHYQRYSIKDVKEYLLNKGVNVRWSR
jgi:cyclase